MRFYQAQADIVVDQLIYGHWGSTAVECMALGKPVVCYLDKRWKENFMDNYPEYKRYQSLKRTPLLFTMY